MTPLLLLSDAAAAGDAIDALKLGAQGQCARRDATVIARAVGAIRNGDAWFPRKVMLHVIQELSRDQSRPAPRHLPFATLTSREHDICGMVGEGGCNKEIAAALGISDKTVKNHLTAIFGKLGLASRLELAVSLLKR